jgi:membrane protease YdiL (CAAX protease family)
MDKFPHWADHIVAFVFCVAVPLLAARQRIKVEPGVFLTSDQKKNIYIASSFSLFIMGAIIMAVWLLFKRPIDEIGLTQPTNTRAWLWIAIAFAIIYTIDAVTNLSSKHAIDTAVDNWKKRTPFLPTKNKELPEYLLMCFSAGVFEEIVYRGYLVTYCWYLFDGMEYQKLLSILVPAFVFSVAHFYQGTKAVMKIFILAILFGYIFMNSGSLLIVMILHFLVDAIGGLLTIKYLKEIEEKEVQHLGDENNFF